MDDTPTANPETKTWLKDYLKIGRDGENRTATEKSHPGRNGASGSDTFEMATEAARSAGVDKAIEIMTRAISQEGSGRGRFERRSQLAQICVNHGHEGVAFPILEEIATEIEQRRLETWDAPDVVAQPLALLYRCMDKLKRSQEEKQRIYQLTCRLDPLQALRLSK